MNYYLTKLEFETAVHFGSGDSALSLYTSEDHFHADTLFSALCHTAGRDAEDLQRLIRLAEEGKLLLSDSMPWKEETLYLPKPVIASDSRREVPGRVRKAMKKLQWIPVLSLPAFSESLHGGEPYSPDEGAAEFGRHTERTMAGIPEEGDARPYEFGLFQFHEGCGLYLVIGAESEEDGEWVLSLLELLGLSGIGGKTSSGFGSFHITEKIRLDGSGGEQARWLHEALNREEGSQLLLTSSLPEDRELESVLDGASYQPLRRGGFVASDGYADTPMKKKTQIFLAAGAVLPCRFQGGLYEVGYGGAHPVYRYSRPVLLGVEL